MSLNASCVSDFVCDVFPGIDAGIKDIEDWTALDILKDHPSQKSQQITALIQGNVIWHHKIK